LVVTLLFSGAGQFTITQLNAWSYAIVNGTWPLNYDDPPASVEQLSQQSAVLSSPQRGRSATSRSNGNSSSGDPCPCSHGVKSPLQPSPLQQQASPVERKETLVTVAFEGMQQQRPLTFSIALPCTLGDVFTCACTKRSMNPAGYEMLLGDSQLDLKDGLQPFLSLPAGQRLTVAERTRDITVLDPRSNTTVTIKVAELAWQTINLAALVLRLQDRIPGLLGLMQADAECDGQTACRLLADTSFVAMFAV
jgi:hypothetical protein